MEENPHTHLHTNEWPETVRSAFGKLSHEMRERIAALGLTEESIVAAGPTADTLRAFAEQQGYDTSKPLGKGMSRRAFLQSDGRVLKLGTAAGFLNQHLDQDDELAFQEQVTAELGEEALLVLAMCEKAARGVPGIIQERVFPTNRAMKLISATDPHLAQDIERAHKANPLAKHYVYEQKITNSGLLVRNGQIFVVAMDTASCGRADIDHVDGRWETIRRDMRNIIPIDIERFRTFPEIWEVLTAQSSSAKKMASS